MRLFMITRSALLCVSAALAAACGGGSGGLTGASPTPTVPAPVPATIPYTPGVFPASSTFAKQCQTPRGGSSGDVKGSTLAENHWLRSWTNELYLWYSEVPENDPSKTATTAAYFDLLKTPAILPSGQVKDRFHFTYDTAKWLALSQGGVSVGYGISWEIINGTVSRRIVVTFVEPGSVAATAGITRGAEALQADGVDIVNVATQAGVDSINAALFPSAAGSHTFRFKDRGTNANRDVSLTAGNVTANPVPVARMLTGVTGNVGYLLFNDHTATAEQALIGAINTLKAGNAQDLILDIRYNGGGYLDIASELAYMIAGPAATAGKAFERIQFSGKYPTKDPVTGNTLSPTPFYSTTQFATSSQSLPTLNLPRVYVLTSNDTCSASESIINGLKGAGVIVYQIGPDTCGKPYGFYPQDNCGTTYFSIEFRGVNELGFGDYPEGFSVTSASVPAQAKLPGCPASDDYAHDLGDQNEERLRVAITYRATNNGTCTGTSSATLASPPSNPAMTVTKPFEPWRDNRIL